MMLSIEKSDFKEEIEAYRKRGGLITTLPPQEEPVRVSAQTKNYREEDDTDDDAFLF